MHNTDAHALQELLTIVNDPESGPSIRRRWEKALDASQGKQGNEFVTRHAEVVNLLLSTIRHIRALPPRQQARYEASIGQWWIAVMSPDQHWGSQHKAALIGVEHINLLGSLGDVIEVRMEATSAAPAGFQIEAVKEQCDEWLATIDGSGLPDTYKRLLVEGINHLSWLIDNADRFGYARVAQAAEAVTGKLAMATAYLTDAARPTWRARMTKWTGTLLAFSALMGSAHLAIENTKQVVNDLEPAVEAIIEAIGDVGTDDDVVDGEIVNEDEAGED